MPYPDLEMRRGGEEGSVSKNFFSSLGASVWSKNYGGRAPQDPLLDPPLETTVFEG